jgi:hypothetical protein
MAGTSPAMTVTYVKLGTIGVGKDYFSRNRETNHGTEIFEESFGRRRARDEKAQGRDAEERPIRQDSQKPQAGNRDRPFRGEGRRRESPEEGIEENNDGQENGQENSQENDQEAESQKVTAP